VLNRPEKLLPVEEVVAGDPASEKKAKAIQAINKKREEKIN